jgi:hypothetical protein
MGLDAKRASAVRGRKVWVPCLPQPCRGHGETLKTKITSIAHISGALDGNAAPIMTCVPLWDEIQMTDFSNIPPVDALKLQAKRLRQQLKSSGVALGHSQSLELVAQQYGARDWNTLQARAGNRLQLRVGDHVRGRYLGQAFTAEVRSLTLMGDGESRQVVLHLDTPVDVVRFESFSSLRQRVRGVIGWDGCSTLKTSDGVPQLVVEGAAKV